MSDATPAPQHGPTSVRLERTGFAEFRITNARGAEITIGQGEGADFTPVELLLAAIAGCSAIDVDHIVSKRAEPQEFSVEVQGTKVRDEDGNHLTDVAADFALGFAEGETGEQAQEVVPRAVAMSRDRLCTVSRTVVLPTPVDFTLADGRSV
ncbi:Uncharacterized OsmC-related protein [Kytococcus aerolatus]|uniref:Uncharacterized OsmC-related protein n=1 Tax=Kytococcus aerolatus TaxID=592308 RepID=A0A212T302_9MICO|nr:OsmC family protein [Kytococcus aerolatus]SNC60154.1 Uncharacterized OsmC-related protein [Kytococcus aerolatus]